MTDDTVKSGRKSSSWPSSMAMNYSSLLTDIFWLNVEKILGVVENGEFENNTEIRTRLDSWSNK